MKEMTIKGWVAREIDGELILSSDKPIKREVESGDMAWVSRGFVSTADYTSFPDLTWESEPTEVEITIKIKE